MKQTAPYGAWKSSITSQMIVEKSIRFRDLFSDGETLYWTEGRPEEKGRSGIMRRIDGKNEDLLPLPFNARTTVHEYGGAALAVHKGILYFSNYDDQRIYRMIPGETPEPITPEENLRFADLVIDSKGKYLYAIREDHRDNKVINTIVQIDLQNPSEGEIIVSGNDFYAFPRLNHDDTKLSWITWNHPNMPWDETELWVATVGKWTKQKVSGGNQVSIFQPEWSPKGELIFVSDKNGWWNLYKWDGKTEIALFPKEAEFGLPLWIFGMRTYDFLGDKIVCTFSKGASHMGILDPKTGHFEEIQTPYETISDVIVTKKHINFFGGGPKTPLAIVSYGNNQFEEYKKSRELIVDPNYISIPEYISFPTENNLEAYAWYYKPTNPDFQAPEGELPPLLVRCHGGPTAHSTNTLKMEMQYWTSRGFAVLDVNYGGSTGHGRAYRERLKDNWGIVDLHDCCNAANYLVAKKEADPNRLAIDGGSAGGYTTLCALTFSDTFKAGASLFGVSDVAALAEDTHKFESRYLDKLIGPYPERADLYAERSPIHHTEKLSCPLILLQGLEDKVVPPSQSEAMFEALKKKGIPTAYVPFEKEQHGFRISKNIIKSLEAEYYFFSQVFNFEPADELEPIDIINTSSGSNSNSS